MYIYVQFRRCLQQFEQIDLLQSTYLITNNLLQMHVYVCIYGCMCVYAKNSATIAISKLDILSGECTACRLQQTDSKCEKKTLKKLPSLLRTSKYVCISLDPDSSLGNLG
jgi:hypothetical protein